MKPGLWTHIWGLMSARWVLTNWAAIFTSPGFNFCPIEFALSRLCSPLSHELFRSVLTSTHLPIFWILIRYYKVFIVFIFKSMGSAASCLPFSSLFCIFRVVRIPTTLHLLCLCFPWSLSPVSSCLLLLSQSSLSKSTPPLLHTLSPPPCHRYGTWDCWFW